MSIHDDLEMLKEAVAALEDQIGESSEDIHAQAFEEGSDAGKSELAEEVAVMMGAIDTEECEDCREVLKRVLNQHVAQFLAVGTHACEQDEDEDGGVSFVISFADN
jgi:flagellar biosynthesis/type III secretory pathway protein FliH